jgi:hypothetical protein
MVTWNVRAAAAVAALSGGLWASSCTRAPEPVDDRAGEAGAPDAGAIDAGAVETGPVTLSVAGHASATPWIAADRDRVAVSWGAQAVGGGTDVYVAVSGDGGRAFGEPVRVNDRSGTARLGGEMAPRVAFAPAAGMAQDAAPLLQVLWTAVEDQRTSIHVARSEDGGRTFGAPRALEDEGAPGDRGWPALAADGQGAVHAVWLDHRGMAAQAGAGHHHHGAGTGGAEEAAAGVAMAQLSALYYAGAAGERELAKGVCYCCKTALVPGPGGALFAAWRHVYPGNLRDIAFTASADGGRTFAAPIRVSEDGWQLNGCPDDGPAMAVGGDGAVHIVWPTVVSEPEPHKALFYATRDSGAFTPRARVSPERRNIAHPQIALSPGGDLVVLWDEMAGGRRQVFVSRKPADAAAFSAPESISDGDAALYPVAVFAGGAFVVAWTDSGGDGSHVTVRRIRPWPTP